MTDSNLNLIHACDVNEVYRFVRVDPICLEFGENLMPLFQGDSSQTMLSAITSMRKQIGHELGYIVPSIRIRDDFSLGPDEYRILIRQNQVAKGIVRMGQLLVTGLEGELKAFKREIYVEPVFSLSACWISKRQRKKAESLGLWPVDPCLVIRNHLSEVIRSHCGELLDFEKTLELIKLTESAHPHLVDYATAQYSNPRLSVIQAVLQKLLDEAVCIRDMPTILDVIAKYVEHAKDIDVLVENTREALGRQICQSLAREDTLSVLTLVPELDQGFADAVQNDGIAFAFTPDEAQVFFDNLTEEVQRVENEGLPPVLICSPLVRSNLRQLIVRVCPELHIIAWNEIPNGLGLVNLGTIEGACSNTTRKGRKLIRFRERELRRDKPQPLEKRDG